MKQLLLVLGLSLVLVGCYHEGSSGTQAPASQEKAMEAKDELTDEEEAMEEEEEAMEAEGVEVEIEDFAFSPATLSTKPGETITVTNLDSVGHTMTSDDAQSFDSGMVGQDETVSFTAPSEPGKYPFHCTPHPNMKGTLTVEG